MGRPLKWGESCRRVTVSLPERLYVDLCVDGRSVSRHDCEKWLERNWGYPVPKSACVGCPYHNDRAWRVMRDHDPKSWGEAVAFDKALRGGEKLPGVKGNVYLHSSRVPLDEVDLRTPEDHGQMSFLDECEGMCGV